MLTHTILYAKSWYKRSKNIWEDLMQTLKADDYTPENKYDIAQIIQGHLVKFIIQENSINQDYKVRSVLEGLNPKESWKHGYYHKDNWKDYTNEYDYYEALVRTYLSLMMETSCEDLGWTRGDLPKPDPNVLKLRRS